MNVPVLERLASSVAAKTAIDFTQDMVRTDSTNGKEDALARQLEARIASLGVGKVWCEKTYEGRLNTLWEVDSGRPGPRLLFTGHLDTKPVCEGWERDPFDGAIENGRLHGHGVMDMKAGLGSLIGGIMTLIESGTELRGKITFAAVADHMGQQTGSIDLFRRYQFDHCVLAELTDMQIYIAHRGRYYFDVSTIGRSAHTCHKYLAINAIEKMLPVIEEISKLKYFPDIPQEMKELVGPSMIPDRCTIRVDTRPQPGVTIQEVRAILQAALDRAKARDPEVVIEMVDADIKDSLLVDPAAPIVVALKAAWERTMGKPAKFHGGSWLGDTASFGRLCETVIFGPGGEPVYQPNESLALADIEAATRIYALTAATILRAC